MITVIPEIGLAFSCLATAMAISSAVKVTARVVLVEGLAAAGTLPLLADAGLVGLAGAAGLTGLGAAFFTGLFSADGATMCFSSGWFTQVSYTASSG
ncbi:hypothetical protein D9M68_849470 [compost metagenome]